MVLLDLAYPESSVPEAQVRYADSTLVFLIAGRVDVIVHFVFITFVLFYFAHLPMGATLSSGKSHDVCTTPRDDVFHSKSQKRS